MASNVIVPGGAEFASGRDQVGAAGRLGTLLAAVRSRLEQRRRYRATVRELSALDDELLADLGISRHDIDRVARQLAAAGRPGR